jgi:zinc transport system ATP-binding protein
MSAPLTARGVTVSLDGRPVLRGVDLEVDAGELVALLGTNGSGKSTLVRATVGLVPLTKGTVELFGTPLEKFREHRRLGYVPQRSHAVAGVPATVREVVMSGRLSRRRFVGLRSAADVTAVESAVARVGLTDRLRSPVADLSGGQQQRVLIARALATEAELLIMDEPTAGVDHDNTESLAELLGGLVHDGASVLLVAHELGPMRPLVDRAVVLSQGRVAYDGPCEGVTEQHAHVHQHSGAPEVPSALGGEGVWQ